MNLSRSEFVNQRDDNSDLIKVGYLLSYDYKYLKYSLPTVYHLADKIFITIDINRKTWAGQCIKIPETFFRWLDDFDVDDKILLYENSFYISGLSTMACETRERNILAQIMGEGGWHIQIDVDEYFLNFKEFVEYLKSIDRSIPTTIMAQWITIFKQNKNEIFYIDSNEEFPVATNEPKYKYARNTINDNVIRTKFKVLHQSWGRSEKDLIFKLKNWGHNKDFDIDSFVYFWKSISKKTYKHVRNFHPLYPRLWEKLDFIEIADIHSLIEEMKNVKL